MRHLPNTILLGLFLALSLAWAGPAVRAAFSGPETCNLHLWIQADGFFPEVHYACKGACDTWDMGACQAVDAGQFGPHAVFKCDCVGKDFPQQGSTIASQDIS